MKGCIAVNERNESAKTLTVMLIDLLLYNGSLADQASLLQKRALQSVLRGAGLALQFLQFFRFPTNPGSIETSLVENIRSSIAGILAKFVFLEVYRPKKKSRSTTKQKSNTKMSLLHRDSND